MLRAKQKDDAKQLELKNQQKRKLHKGSTEEACDTRRSKSEICDAKHAGNLRNKIHKENNIIVDHKMSKRKNKEDSRNEAKSNNDNQKKKEQTKEISEKKSTLRDDVKNSGRKQETGLTKIKEKDILLRQNETKLKTSESKTMESLQVESKRKSSKSEKHNHQEQFDYHRAKGKLKRSESNRKEKKDEVDDDKVTSDYFISDSKMEFTFGGDRRRKRKIVEKEKPLPSKVKYPKMSSPVSVSPRTAESKDDDSCDSDFEDVLDVTSLSSKENGSLVNKKSHVGAKIVSKRCKSNRIGSESKNQLKKANKIKVQEDESKSNRKRKISDVKNEFHENMPSKRTKKEKKIEMKEAKNTDTGKPVKHKNIITTKKKHNNAKTPNHMEKLKSIDHSDVTALLLHMEGPGAIAKPSTSYAADEEIMSDDDIDEEGNDSDESEGDWEDVEDHHSHSPVKSQLPDKPVEITLEAPVIYKKRKKREFDIKAYFQKQINKYKKELNISMHKVHLLCLLSRGFYLNNLCSDETLRAQAMSVSIATRELKIASVKSSDVTGLSYMITWMKQAFPVKNIGEDQSVDMRRRLESCFEQRHVTSRLEFVLVCVILLRQLGFLTRLVMSFQPIPIRTTAKKDTNAGRKQIKGNPARIRKLKETGTTDSKTENKGAKSSGKAKSSETLQNKSGKIKGNSKRSSTKSTDEQEAKGETKEKNRKKGTHTENSLKAVKKKVKEEHSVSVKDENEVNYDSEKEINNNKLRTKNKSRRSCASKIRPNVYVDNDGEFDDSEDEFVPVENDNGDDSGSDFSDEEDMKKEAMKTGKVKKEDVESSGSDFAEESFQIRTQALKKVTPVRRNKKALSSDSGEIAGNSTGADEWVEVYLQKEKKWICIDCVSSKLDKPHSLEHNATPPVHYIVGFCEDGVIKDVTARYASQWLTNTCKFRADEDWWVETMDLYKTNNTKLDEQEDREIQSHLLQRPLPTNIGAFKNHPLYALKRHLLKFEAIYPETAVPLGYIRGEPVYARECVHVLHSRENWLKEGRAVRIGEEAYKHVKSRPKWNKPKENPDALDLEVFGRWQTEVYIPPPAVDGKVPRNAHGNVELFLPSMLPAGTVHLQIPGLNKVAKKLDIDCAPAMVGWDHHCGFSHPLMDGWIVCEEYKDILLAAWDEEQEIIREKEQEKKEKRVYGNWKLLIKGLLIKQRLKKRFDLEEEKTPIEETTTTDDKESEKTEKAADYNMSWPQNRQTHKQTHFDVEKL